MERSKTSLCVPALVIWLSVQVAVLALCADRVTFWARSPAAAEQLALAAMLCEQIGTSALIFPKLLGSRRSTILAIVTGWPLAQLAAYLSDASPSHAAAGEVYVSAWMIGLSFFSPLVRTESAQLIGAAVAAMIGLGGPVALYLHLEFAAPAAAPSQSLGWFGPVTGALSQIWAAESRAGSILAWTWPVGIIAVGAAVNFSIRKRRDKSRQVIH